MHYANYLKQILQLIWWSWKKMNTDLCYSINSLFMTSTVFLSCIHAQDVSVNSNDHLRGCCSCGLTYVCDREERNQSIVTRRWLNVVKEWEWQIWVIWAVTVKVTALSISCKKVVEMGGGADTTLKVRTVSAVGPSVCSREGFVL